MAFLCFSISVLISTFLLSKISMKWFHLRILYCRYSCLSLSFSGGLTLSSTILFVYLFLQAFTDRSGTGIFASICCLYSLHLIFLDSETSYNSTALLRFSVAWAILQQAEMQIRTSFTKANG